MRRRYSHFGAELDIVAYKERETEDPETGEPGILRNEWRVREVSEFTPEELVAAFGTDWRRYKPFATHVLEHRYIRHGKIEPWIPVDVANSEKRLLEYIDTNAAALSPLLKEIQHEREQYNLRQQQQAEEKAQREHEAEERQYHQDRAGDAFRRLRASKDSSWATRWNAWITEHQTESAKQSAKNDPEFMRLYQRAMEAETVPAKRSAIKAFLKYVEGNSKFGFFNDAETENKVMPLSGILF